MIDFEFEELPLIVSGNAEAGLVDIAGELDEHVGTRRESTMPCGTPWRKPR